MRTRTPSVLRHIYTAAPARRTRGCVSAASVCSDFSPRSKSRSAACLRYGVSRSRPSSRSVCGHHRLRPYRAGIAPGQRYSTAAGQLGAISQIEHGRRSYAASPFAAAVPSGDAIFHQSSVTAPMCLSAVPMWSSLSRLLIDWQAESPPHARPASSGVYTERKTKQQEWIQLWNRTANPTGTNPRISNQTALRGKTAASLRDLAASGLHGAAGGGARRAAVAVAPDPSNSRTHNSARNHKSNGRGQASARSHKSNGRAQASGTAHRVGALSAATEGPTASASRQAPSSR